MPECSIFHLKHQEKIYIDDIRTYVKRGKVRKSDENNLAIIIKRTHQRISSKIFDVTISIINQHYMI